MFKVEYNPKIWFFLTRSGHQRVQFYLKILVPYFSFVNLKEAVRAPWWGAGLTATFIIRQTIYLVHILKSKCIFVFKNKVNEIKTRRQAVSAELQQLANTLRKHQMVRPHLTLTEELEFIYNWANTDGTKSCLPEIYKQIDAIKLKVREQINLRFVPFLHLTCFSLFAGIRI